MAEDWFVGAVERVTENAREACVAIERAVGALRQGRETHDAGHSLVDVVDVLIAAGGRETAWARPRRSGSTSEP